MSACASPPTTRSLGISDEEQKLLDAIASVRKVAGAAREALMQAKRAGRTEESTQIYETQFVPANASYLASIGAYRDHERAVLDRSAQDMRARIAAGGFQLAGLGCLALVLGGIFAWRLTVSITRPMARASALADAVAAGDLTQQIEVDGRDEIAGLMAALGRMRSHLHGIVSQVRLSTDGIHTASR